MSCRLIVEDDLENKVRILPQRRNAAVKVQSTCMIFFQVGIKRILRKIVENFTIWSNFVERKYLNQFNSLKTFALFGSLRGLEKINSIVFHFTIILYLSSVGFIIRYFTVSICCCVMKYSDFRRERKNELCIS